MALGALCSAINLKRKRNELKNFIFVFTADFVIERLLTPFCWLT